jgi:predicted acyl esterase
MEAPMTTHPRSISRRVTFVPLEMLLAVCFWAAGAPAEEPAVEVAWGVKIPMRDGVALNAAVYRPHAMPEPLPVVVTLTSGLATQWKLFGESDHWKRVFGRWYREHRALTDLPELAGNPATAFLEWAAHPYPDAYWDAMNPTDEEFARLELPILTITGHHDAEHPIVLEIPIVR